MGPVMEQEGWGLVQESGMGDIAMAWGSEQNLL